ncbi:MAG: hypothetical protein LLG06_04010, partial [Desulfobacteraceae bacterium]|nr:hypothetical protein [Desulfobacteraceae bacterium]
APAAGAREGRPAMDYRYASAHTARERMKKWNMSNRQIEDVSALIESQLPFEADSWSAAEIRRFLSTIRGELLEDVLAFAEAVRLADGRESIERAGGPGETIRRQAATASALRLEDLAVSGGDVMKVLGLDPGPEVGKVLRRLLTVVIEDPARNDHETLVGIIRREYRR